MNNNFIKRNTLPIFVGFIYSFLYLPIFVVILFSFNKQEGSGFQWKGFTLEWYKVLFHSKEVGSVVQNSLIVAFCAVFLSLVLGIALSWGFYRRKSRIFSVFYSTILIPEIVISVGLLSLFNFLSVPLGLNTLILSHTLLGLGFVLPIIHVRFQELNYRLIEASMDLGANMFKTFFSIVLPFLFPAILSSGLLVFIISLDDFLISFFCSSATSQTLPLYIFSSIRTGMSPLITALSTSMFTVSLILVSLFIFISAKFLGPKHD